MITSLGLLESLFFFFGILFFAYLPAYLVLNRARTSRALAAAGPGWGRR